MLPRRWIRVVAIFAAFLHIYGQTYLREANETRALAIRTQQPGYLIGREVRITFDSVIKRQISYTYASAPILTSDETFDNNPAVTKNVDLAAPLEIHFCNTSTDDVNLEQLVRSPGTRMVVLMLYNSPETFHRVLYCRDWIVPVLIRKNKYLESIVYKDILTPVRMEILKKNVDFVFLCTYKAWLLSNTPITANFIESMLLDAKHHRFHAIPLDNTHDTHANILQSLLATHTPAAINCWNVLLINLNFTAVEIQYSTKIATYWSSMLIRTPVLEKLSLVMRQAIDIVENPKLGTLQKYFSTETQVKGADPNLMKQIFGTTNFRMHPFIFERLHVFLLLMMRAKLPIWNVNRMRLPPISKVFAPFAV
eukprot:gene23225-28211_t